MANLQSTNIFGTLYVKAQTGSNSSANGALVVLGGAGIAGNLNVGGDLSVSGNIGATGKALTVGTINGLTITNASGKTLNLSNASLTIGDAKKTGTITIKGDSDAPRTLTLGGSPTLAGSKTVTATTNLTVEAGDVVIKGASDGSTLTLPVSLTVGALSDGAVLFANGANTIGGESQLAISRGGTGKSLINPKYALLGPATGETNGSPSWRAITSDDIKDATNINTASKIVKRDETGNFTAGTITAELSGNASTATILKEAKTLWGQSFNGGGNITGDISSTGDITPSKTDAKDLGSSAFKYKDAFLSGTLNASSVSTSGNVSISGDLGVASINTSGNVSIGGNLTVTGTTYFKHEATLEIADKNIELGVVEGEGKPSNATAKGGGITLKGGTDGDKTIVWNLNSNNPNWTSSEHWNLASGKEYKINNASVLSSTTLGTSVLTSSLTSVGNLKTVTVVDVDATANTNKIKIAPENKSKTNKTITISTHTNGYTSDRTYTLPDAGKNALFVMTEGDQTINGAKTFSSNITGDLTGNVTGDLTGNVTGDLTGNADTVTNGIYTTGSYSDPSWLSISKTKVGLSNVENTALSTWAGTTNITKVGAISATSINKVAITAPATSATLTIADGKTLTVNNTITLSGTNGKTLNIGDGGTLDTGAFAPKYSLPTASSSILGGVKIGAGITITNGSISITTGTGLNLNDKTLLIDNTVVATLGDSQTFSEEKEFGAGLKTNKVKMSKFTWQYNGTEDSMDLVYSAT